jgi:diguanylate cyclase (GGDEF)-like protein/PAS domain S-box-containing protein
MMPLPRRRSGWRPLRALLVLALVAWLLLPTGPARAGDLATDRPTLTIGVLAIQSAPVEQARWGAVERALIEALPQYRLRWQPLRFPELDRAIATHRLDAVITNPGHALALVHELGAAPLASVVRQIAGEEIAALAGVVWVRADSPLQRWADLAGRRVAVVHEESLGGRWLQTFELVRRGIDPDRIDWRYAGPGHDSVIDSVLRGEADAAFVRAGIWEARVASGRADPRRLRPLEPQQLPGYPFAASTPLYPDWTVLALVTTPEPVRRDLAAALLALQLAPAARAQVPDDGVVGFAPPQATAATERVLRTMRVRPFAPLPLTWRERLAAAAPLLAATGAGVLTLAIFATRVWRQKRRLRELLAEQAIQARVFDSDFGILITDDNQRIQRVNAAFTRVTGYRDDEVIGKTPKILSSGRHDAAFYQAMWASIRELGGWQGEVWNRRKNGEIYPEWLSISTVTDADGRVRHYVAVFSDIGWRKAAEAHIERLTTRDPLTDLLNRHGLLVRLENALARCRTQQSVGALLLIDLDQFRLINEVHDAAAGDQVLRECARRLREQLYHDDTVARLGGDEFAVVLPPSHADRHLAAFAAQAVAERLRTALAEPIALPSGASVQLTASIGIALIEASDRATADWLQAADLAMQQAKRAGRNTIHFFDPALEAQLAQEFALRQALAQAIDAGELQLYAQPQFDSQRRLVGAELLLRWQRADGSMVSPAQFIPLAEASGLIVPIGRWVRAQAVATLLRWRGQPQLAKLKLAVNVSAREFAQDDFVAAVAEAVEPLGGRARQLELEITESVFMADLAAAKAALTALKASGVQLALDDFGTGYSSLSYLSELPFDCLKIDQRFVARVACGDKQGEAIAATIITLGRKLGMVVLAEGVETEAQERYLTAQGCHQLQGYLLARPMPLAQFEAWAMAAQVTETR